MLILYFSITHVREFEQLIVSFKDYDVALNHVIANLQTKLSNTFTSYQEIARKFPTMNTDVDDAI